MRRILVLLIVLLLSVFPTACRQENRKAVTETKGPVLYSVTDITGTKLDFRAKPSRIVSFGSSVDEILLDTVEPQRIAGLTTVVDNPTISPVAEKAKQVPHRIYVNASENVISLKPDLVIMPDWLDATIVQTIRRLGIPVYIYHTPVTMEEIRKSILDVTAAVGETEKGRLLVAKMQERLEKVSRAVGNIPPAKKHSIIAMSQMGAFGAKGTTFDDLCRKANIINALTALNLSMNATVSKEQIVMLNPDFLLLPDWVEKGKTERDVKKYWNEIRNDPAYANMKAVKNNHLISIHDKYLYSTTHYAVYAVEELAAAVYPEFFKAEKHND